MRVHQIQELKHRHFDFIEIDIIDVVVLQIQCVL